MIAIAVALTLGALAGGAIAVAVAREDYEARTPPTLTRVEWQRIRAERTAATIAAAALGAADAAARLFEAGRRASIWLAPRRYPS